MNRTIGVFLGVAFAVGGVALLVLTRDRAADREEISSPAAPAPAPASAPAPAPDDGFAPGFGAPPPPAPDFPPGLTAPPAAAPAGPPVPDRPLSAADLERMTQEANRQAQEAIAAKDEKALALFVDICGPLDPLAGRALLDAYGTHHEEAYKDWRTRMDKAFAEAERSGEPVDPPDREAVYAEHRQKTYAKLAEVLTAEQLGKFKAWWEENTGPRDR